MQAYEVIGYLICRHRQNLPLTDESEFGSIQFNEDMIKCSNHEPLLNLELKQSEYPHRFRLVQLSLQESKIPFRYNDRSRRMNEY
jgi:hypothetical protein